MRYVLKAIDYTRDGYASVVEVLVRRSFVGLVVLAAVVGGVWYLGKITPTGFLPSEDQGAFFVEIQMPEGSSVNRTTKVSQRVEDILMDEHQTWRHKPGATLILLLACVAAGSCASARLENADLTGSAGLACRSRSR